ncbi:hypothetical protein RI129_003109 [Pyrocoelia pectoralis]|uniref:THAP-type domain-containing protein n=1 Tax=Pyrocoelia pectoralis TaxID=417401 RepID=A0AAN7ZMS0_9COLE
MNSDVYRWCAVPQCNNTSIKTPNKLFIHVPKDKKVRNTWLNLSRRDRQSSNSVIYFCEDHFDVRKIKKSSTIWTNYSMQRTMLNIKQNTDISKFARLIASLKTFSQEYQPKKSKILECKHITKFLSEAPDNIQCSPKSRLQMDFFLFLIF